MKTAELGAILGYIYRTGVANTTVETATLCFTESNFQANSGE